MRIRTKFLAVLLVELIGFLGLSALSVATFARVREMQTVVENGMSLIARSRRVYSLLKDVVFDLFTPDSYQALRSVVLAPRSLVTGKEFAHETGLFRDEYGIFMRDGMITYILQRNPRFLLLSKQYLRKLPQPFCPWHQASGGEPRARPRRRSPPQGYRAEVVGLHRGYNGDESRPFSGVETSLSRISYGLRRISASAKRGDAL